MHILSENFRLQQHACHVDEDINWVYKDRQHVLKQFWEPFESSYVCLLRLMPKWQKGFPHDILTGSFVLFKALELVLR